MGLRTRTSPGDLDPEIARWVDDACDRYDAAVLAGEAPSIDSIVARAPEWMRDVLRAELLDIEDPAAPAPSDTWDVRALQAYEVLGEQGRGGMGIVYKARDRRLGRFVCIKVLPSEAAASPARLVRFQQEARAISSLNHPNICTVYELGEHGGRPFLVLEWIDGATLDRHAQIVAATDVAPPASGPVAPSLIGIAQQVARALEVAHAAGVVHRDIKPDNVMVRPDGIAKVLDFGLARLLRRESDDDAVAIATEAGIVLGTVHFMSPEQARGEPVGPPSDVFSLGIVLYQLATGRHPFEGPTTARILARIDSEDPTPPATHRPAIDPALASLVTEMLAKDPARRPTAAAVAERLGAAAVTTAPVTAAAPALAGPSSAASSAATGATAVTTPRSRRGFIIGVALFIAVLAALGTWIALDLVAHEGRAPQDADAAHTPTIAVMPFAAHGTGTYYGDGVADDIIAMLARAPDLAVVSRSTSFGYATSATSATSAASPTSTPPAATAATSLPPVDPIAVGAALGVDYLVEGSVASADGGKVRIIAQLVDAKTGRDVWSERFDKTSADPWQLQDEVAGRIVGALAGDLGQIKRLQYQQSWGHDSAGAAEYDYYLRGHERYMRFTRADNEAAVAIFDEGLAKFPDSALLQAKSGWAHFNRPFLYYTGDDGDYARASELVQKSLAHADASPLERRIAHWLYAYVSAQEHEYDRAKREADATMQLAPYDAFQNGDLAIVMILAGDLDRAIALTTRALAIDAANASYYREVRGWALTLAGRYGESETDLAGAFDIAAVPVLHAINHTRLGDPAAAKADVRKALALEPGLSLARWRAANFYRDASALDAQLRDLAAAGMK